MIRVVQGAAGGASRRSPRVGDGGDAPPRRRRRHRRLRPVASRAAITSVRRVGRPVRQAGSSRREPPRKKVAAARTAPGQRRPTRTFARRKARRPPQARSAAGPSDWNNPFSSGEDDNSKRGAAPAGKARWRQAALTPPAGRTRSRRRARQDRSQTRWRARQRPRSDDSKWATAHGAGGDAPGRRRRWGIRRRAPKVAVARRRSASALPTATRAVWHGSSRAERPGPFAREGRLQLRQRALGLDGHLPRLYSRAGMSYVQAKVATSTLPLSSMWNAGSQPNRVHSSRSPAPCRPRLDRRCDGPVRGQAPSTATDGAAAPRSGQARGPWQSESWRWAWIARSTREAQSHGAADHAALARRVLPAAYPRSPAEPVRDRQRVRHRLGGRGHHVGRLVTPGRGEVTERPPLTRDRRRTQGGSATARAAVQPGARLAAPAALPWRARAASGPAAGT